MKRELTVLLLLGTLSACAGNVEDEPFEPGSTTESQLSWMEANTDHYLGEASWRREQMQDALWRPELPYARKRLSGYAKEEGGWDLLTEIDTETSRVDADGNSVATHRISTEIPTSRDGWLALGEDVFWHMPMRAAPYLQWLSTQPKLWDEVGLQRNADGSVRGLARFTTARGEQAVGATCGLCHGNAGVAGDAVPNIDLGLARARFVEAHGGDGTEFDTWPKGSIDVTDDGVTDPVSIPDLWSVEHNTYLNASGVIRMSTPAALAVRLETQYLVGHSLEARPNRVQMWALTMYVLSLSHEGTNAETSPEGEAVFSDHCSSCHRPEQAYAGGLVASETINSDPQAAFSAYRGTGFYKVPSLVGVSDGGPYLHDNSAATLEDLLDMSHPYGVELTTSERSALLDFLKTL